MNHARLSALVSHGAQLLDTIEPNWARKINTESLDMSSPFDDVICQLYGDYATGIKHILSHANKGDDEFMLGLDVQDSTYYDDLNYLWSDEIFRRTQR